MTDKILKFITDIIGEDKDNSRFFGLLLFLALMGALVIVFVLAAPFQRGRVGLSNGHALEQRSFEARR